MVFGTTFAMFMVLLKFFYFNNINSYNLFVRMVQTIKPRVTAQKLLFLLWAICSFRQLFELDVLKYMHYTGVIDPISKHRRMPLPTEV